MSSLPRVAVGLRPNGSLTITMLDRLGRDTLELIASAQDIEHRDRRRRTPQQPVTAIARDFGVGRSPVNPLPGACRG
ncbi:hypothetical protein OG788_03240 [Streptomyces sp. NBC_00647]|uniref:hypothetical protein n=1 Tax=Streptomyces sp. NBC_00647 TaxID=2975796 RepID=UPI00324E6DD8